MDPSSERWKHLKKYIIQPVAAVVIATIGHMLTDIGSQVLIPGFREPWAPFQRIWLSRTGLMALGVLFVFRAFEHLRVKFDIHIWSNGERERFLSKPAADTISEPAQKKTEEESWAVDTNHLIRR